MPRMSNVDVAILTKNSEKVLRECLTSVYENVPVKRLIVVDGNSTDSTINILKEFQRKYGNLKLVRTEGTRGSARQIALNHVQTEWFMFVDSDVILCKNWFEKAVKNINDNVGAVWGLNFDITPNTRNAFFLRLLAILAERCFSLRGGLHDTLIRREALEGIRIPEWLHTYEDAYIINWIKGKGYKVIVGDDLYCLHYRSNQHYTFKAGMSAAVTEIKCGLVYSHLYKYTFYYPLLTFNWMIQALHKNFEGR